MGCMRCLVGLRLAPRLLTFDPKGFAERSFSARFRDPKNRIFGSFRERVAAQIGQINETDGIKLIFFHPGEDGTEISAASSFRFKSNCLTILKLLRRLHSCV